MRTRTTKGRLLSALAALGALAACADVYLTAPPGATISLEANPPFVASHGGTSDVTAVVMEETGTPVADGTVIFWSTNIGRIDRETRTRNGFTAARFVSDARSGTATIRAFSGGGSNGGGGGGTTTTTRPPSTTVNSTSTGAAAPWYMAERASSGGTAIATGGVLGGGIAAASSVSSAMRAEDTITIEVGNVRVTTVHLRADPPRITTSNSTHVFAVVLDAAGNPVENVPVWFEVVTSATTPVQEFFDFTGPVFTNNNGEAENVLRTRRQSQGVVQVRARAAAAGGFKVSDPLNISIL